jgi:hypothetical protein
LASGSGSTPTPRKRDRARTVGRQAHELDSRKDRGDVGIACRDLARAPRVVDAELERHVLGLADGARVHGLELSDGPDRSLAQRLERLGDEASRQGERGETERHDRDHEKASPSLPGEIAEGQREGVHGARSDAMTPSCRVTTRRARRTTLGSCVAKRNETPGTR